MQKAIKHIGFFPLTNRLSNQEQTWSTPAINELEAEQQIVFRNRDVCMSI